jgi:hypothetical protein
MPLRADIEARLNDAVFGTATAGSSITATTTITNVNSVVFQLDNVILHARSRLDDLGDDALYVHADTWAKVPRADLDVADLPKQAYEHGTLTSDGKSYKIIGLSTDGSILRLSLSSELV